MTKLVVRKIPWEFDGGTDMTTFFGASIGPVHSTES
jgi:hypothetical protein